MAGTTGRKERAAKWAVYKAAGGKLGFLEWEAAGSPAKDEKPTADGMDKFLYQTYLWEGGKLSYSAWLAVGKPRADRGKPPKDTGASATVTPPQPTPPTPTPPQVPKVNPVTGEVTYVDDPSWLTEPPPTIPPITPPFIPPITPPTTPPGLPGEVGLPPEAQGGHMVVIGKRWFYRGKNGIYYDLVDGQWLPVDPDTINIILKSGTEAEDEAAAAAAAEDRRRWEAEAEEDRRRWEAEAEAAAAALALAREKYEEEKRRYEEEKRRREYLEQVERERQQAEARNKEWMLRYDIQREASESAIQKQQNELELIRGRAFPFGDELGRRIQGAKDMSGAFESARQSILASLSSPADWIKRWEVQNAPNPFTAQTQASPLEQKSNQFNQTSARAGAFDRMAAESEKLVAQLSSDQDYGAGTPNEAAVLTQARNDAVMYRQAAAAEREILAAYRKDLDYLNAQPQSEAPAAQGRGSAPAPAWLPMFAPGQREGQAITRENVATPSAQQWAGTPWSVQQGLSGYLDWAGYRPMADVLSNMAQMLPNAPGGGARWSPYIGR